MKRLLVFTLVISALTLVGFWGGKEICMRMWPAGLNPRAGWYLAPGLSPDQTASLKTLEASFRPKADGLCMRICGERFGLLNLMTHPEPDPVAINGKIDRIGGLQVQLEKEIASHILRVKKHLGPEQSAAYVDRIHREFRESMKRSGYAEVLAQ